MYQIFVLVLQFCIFQFNSEREQQKLHYQLARITEINTQLNALMNASELPQHLALATPALDPSKVETQVKRLKDQNHQLTEVLKMLINEL